MNIDYHDLADKMQRVTWHGRYFRAFCPFHNDEEQSVGALPSLLVYEDGAVCLGYCSRRYSLEQVYRKIARQPDGPAKRIIPTKDTIGWKWLDDEELSLKCSQAAIDLDNSFQDPTRMYVTDKRLIDMEIVKSLGIGMISGKAISIPVEGLDGAVMSAVLRRIDNPTESERYYQCRPPAPYCPDWVGLQNCEIILLPFGMFDAIHIYQLIQKKWGAKYGVITSTHGKNFKPEWLAPYRKRILPIPDLGEEVAATKLMMQFGWRGMKPLLLPYRNGLKDPADFCENGLEAELWKRISSVR